MRTYQNIYVAHERFVDCVLLDEYILQITNLEIQHMEIVE